MRQEKRPEVIIRAEKGVIEVGAYEELLTRLLIYQARVNVCPAFLIWFEAENLNTVLNVIRE